MKPRIAIVMVAGLYFSVPALAADKNGHGELAEAMIREGAAPAQAACLVERLGDEGERLFSPTTDDLTGDDWTRVMTAMDACSDVDAGAPAGAHIPNNSNQG